MAVRALAAEAVFETLGWHGDLGVRGGGSGHGGSDGLLGKVRLGTIVLRLRRALLVAVRGVVGGSGARGRLLRGGSGARAGAVGGESARDLLLLLLLLLLVVWLVVVWRGGGGGGGNGRTLLWRGAAVQTVRGSWMGQQRGGSLARHGDGPSGEIGELDAAHQVLGEPLHDVWGQAMSVCDDVGQVGGEATGGGRAIVLARLQRLQGPWLGRGKVRTALLLAVTALRGGGSLLLLLLL